MIKPEPQVIKSLALAVRQYPELVSWLEAVLAHELKRLPYAVDNPTLFQGRCQMVSEIVDFVRETPATAARL